MLAVWILCVAGIWGIAEGKGSAGTTAATSTNDDCTQSTCVINEPTLRFYHYGDWGGIATPPYVSAIQRKTAAALGKHAAKTKPHFLISPGDQFYRTGVADVTDSRFKTTFEDIYTDKSLFIPWYMTAGNHDFEGNLSAQYAYSKVSTRWKFPDGFYTVSYVFDKDVQVNFVEQDQLSLCGDDGEDELGKQPIGPLPNFPAQKWWKWTDYQITKFAKTSAYVFPFGHFPMICVRGMPSTTCLQQHLAPIMEANQVHTYLCGHSHSLQHTQFVSDDGFVIENILSGGGAYNVYDFKHIKDLTRGGKKHKLLHCSPANKTSTGVGFVYIELNRTGGRADYIDNEGTTMYTMTFPARPLGKPKLF